MHSMGFPCGSEVNVTLDHSIVRPHKHFATNLPLPDFALLLFFLLLFSGTERLRLNLWFRTAFHRFLLHFLQLRKGKQNRMNQKWSLHVTGSRKWLERWLSGTHKKWLHCSKRSSRKHMAQDKRIRSENEFSVDDKGGRRNNWRAINKQVSGWSAHDQVARFTWTHYRYQT